MYNPGIYNHAVLGKVVRTVKNAKNFHTSTYKYFKAL